jgi:hypothetical protein
LSQRAALVKHATKRFKHGITTKGRPSTTRTRCPGRPYSRPGTKIPSAYKIRQNPPNPAASSLEGIISAGRAEDTKNPPAASPLGGLPPLGWAIIQKDYLPNHPPASFVQVCLRLLFFRMYAGGYPPQSRCVREWITAHSRSPWSAFSAGGVPHRLACANKRPPLTVPQAQGGTARHAHRTPCYHLWATPKKIRRGHHP